MSFSYLVTSDTIGHQDQKLGKLLMHSFFLKLSEADKKPSHIFFLEKGVHLLLPEFSALDALEILEKEKGVTLLACQTCLDYYGIKDKIKVGKIATMPEIIAALQESDKVIHI